jgi:hypothetical protein
MSLARFAFQACAFIRLRSRLVHRELRRDVPPKRRSREGGQPLGHLSGLESTTCERSDLRLSHVTRDCLPLDITCESNGLRTTPQQQCAEIVYDIEMS